MVQLPYICPSSRTAQPDYSGWQPPATQHAKNTQIQRDQFRTTNLYDRQENPLAMNHVTNPVRNSEMYMISGKKSSQFKSHPETHNA